MIIESPKRSIRFTNEAFYSGVKGSEWGKTIFGWRPPTPPLGGSLLTPPIVGNIEDD